MYLVRFARKDDMPRIEEIYAYARAFMASHGNPDQWGNSHPPVSLLFEDIDQRRLYVVTDENGIHGVFYYSIGADPTYAVIREGDWHSACPYGTIHRIAGDGSGGILKTAVEFAKRNCSCVRIDTHHDNLVMQKALSKLGFQRCGIIYLPDGSPRIAYDYI